MQLATIKAKSEALRLRQEFELEKFRAKYRSAADAGDSPEHAARTADAATKGAAAGAGVADEERLGLGTSSDGSLSIGADEAFDEPLKVSSLLMHGCSYACLCNLAKWRHLRISIVEPLVYDIGHVFESPSQN